MIEILPMAREHIEKIAEIERECFSLPWSEKSLEEELTNDGAIFLVAMEDEKVVGYMGANFIMDEGYITNIAVTEKYRKKGIGSKLLQKMCEEAYKRNLSFLTLEVRISNEKAINLYKKFGFDYLGIRKNFYEKPREDGGIMTKYFNKQD